MTQRWNKSIHNKPVFLYCPKFMSPIDFNPLEISIMTQKFHFSHTEPKHRFTASFMDQYVLEVRKKDDKWLYSTEFKISENAKMSLTSNGNYAAAFNTDICNAIVTKNSLAIMKQLNFDSIMSVFLIKFGTPIKFNVNFHAGNFTTGCVVSTSKDDSNSFQFSYESPRFSNSCFVVFNPLSLKNFTISDTISLKKGPLKVSGSILFSMLSTIYSIGARYKSSKLTAGYQFKINEQLANIPNAPQFVRKIKLSSGIKYKFPNCVGKLLLYNEHCGIGGEFRYENNIIKPILKMKYDQSEYGFGLEFTNDN